MQHKRLVIDANILIRAVLGARVRQLIAAGCANVAIYAAEEQFEEASRYLAHLAPRLLNCPIWTEDRDFFGTGVPTWITANVHRYFEIASA